MDRVEKEYYSRLLLSRYALTKIDAIYEAIEAFKPAKMFKVDGSKTKAFSKVIEPLLPYQINKVITKDDMRMTVQSIRLNPSYSSLELWFRACVSYEGQSSTDYFDIKLNLCTFESMGMGYDYNSISRVRPLEELIETLSNYTNASDLAFIKEGLRQREALLEQLKAVENTLPYYSYGR